MELRGTAAAESIVLRLHPAGMISAAVCTVAVLVSAGLVAMLAPALGAAGGMGPPILGGLVAFNNLLLLPPGSLAGHTRRLPVVLAANLLPLGLMPLLYAASPALADTVLVPIAAAAVLVRPLSAMAAALGLMAALNALIPLVLAGAAPAAVGAAAAIIGTVLSVAADAAAGHLLGRAAPDLDRRLLARALADFLGELAQGWRAGRPWPEHRLAAWVVRVRGLAGDIALASPAEAPTPGGAALPLEMIVAGIGRCADALHRQRAALPRSAGTAGADVVARALDGLAEAARDGSAPRARVALATIEDAAGGADAPPGLLDLALLLSDLVEATLPAWEGPRP